MGKVKHFLRLGVFSFVAIKCSARMKVEDERNISFFKDVGSILREAFAFICIKYEKMRAFSV